jgi:hypothetical protein
LNAVQFVAEARGLSSHVDRRREREAVRGRGGEGESQIWEEESVVVVRALQGLKGVKGITLRSSIGGSTSAGVGSGATSRAVVVVEGAELMRAVRESRVER